MQISNFYDRVSTVREKVREIPVWPKVRENSGNFEMGQGISQIYGKLGKSQGTLYISMRAQKVWVERLDKMKFMFQDIELNEVDILILFLLLMIKFYLWLDLQWWLLHSHKQWWLLHNLYARHFCSGCWVEDIKNNAWVTMNNDFGVTSEAICQ